MRAVRPALLALLLSACATFPEIDARIPPDERAGPPPALVPIGPLLARADAPGPVDPAPALEGRAAGLAARAAGLRGPVVSAADAQRLAQGVDLSALADEEAE